MRKLVTILALVAAPVWAEDAALTEEQTQAIAVLQPMLQESLPEEHAVPLANCMVTTAKKREVRRIAKADPEEPSEKIVKLSNKIISRPAVLECMTEKLKK